MIGLRTAVFVLVTALLTYVSRASLLRPRSHGFYRYFAWEAILALILLNIPVWFQSWLAWHQIISWILLLASIIPLVLGVGMLRGRGRGDYAKRPDKELLGFERTTKLVTDGVYHYIRHPLYSSLLILAWGLFFKEPSPLGALLAASASLLLFATAKRDEAECVQVFGKEYERYAGRTRMFIPYVF